MQDNELQPSKVPEDSRERKKEWPTVGTRVAPEELHLIDAAAYKTGKKRARLVHEAVMDRVREVLGLPHAA